MRIAIVHSFYSSNVPSGENQVVVEQTLKLMRAGHDVLLVARHTDRDSRLPAYGIRAALRVATGFGPDPAERLRRFGPDVVILHNLFPNIATHWLRDWTGPIVAVLHNFRPLCANGLLFRDGRICTECADGVGFASLRHSCYRGSRWATLPVAIANRSGTEGSAIITRADRVVTLSRRSRDVYLRYHVPEDKLVVMPNFVSSVHRAASQPPPEERWATVGRLTPEKGFAALVQSWPPGKALDVIGEGPERSSLEALGEGKNVRVLGAYDKDDVRRVLPDYTGLVFPSVCLENLPTVVLESFEAGVPVVAREGSAGSDAVADSHAGFVYSSDESLLAALESVVNASCELRQTARLAFETTWSEAVWLESMLELLHSCIATGEEEA